MSGETINLHKWIISFSLFISCHVVKLGQNYEKYLRHYYLLFFFFFNRNYLLSLDFELNGRVLKI